MANGEYWKDRITKENEKVLHSTINETERELRKLYRTQSEKLYAQIQDVFLKIVSDSEDGKVYLNDLYRTKAYNELLTYFNQCAKAIGGEQVVITERSLIAVYERAMNTVGKYTPKRLVNPYFVVPNAIEPKDAIHRVWCLDGKEFSDRIWLSKSSLVKDLHGAMADFVARGETPYQISQGIVKRLAIDEASAYRIVRTETAHAQIMGQTEKYKEMGFSHGRFVAADPCDSCGALDGQLFTLDEIETLIPVHPNCECSFTLEV